MAKLMLTALAKAHDVASFDCGVAPLNEWFRTTARQHDKIGTSRTYVLIEVDQPGRVLGFVAVAPRTPTPAEELPAELRKRLPRNVFGYTLARLAVAAGMQGRGYGERLLFEAMEKTWRAAQLVGGYALFVDAKAGAAAFYEKYGFRALRDEPDILVLPFASMPPFPPED